ncbi:MAG: thermonuclease family protein [Rhodobacteraceae bacterium]|nr:thermonuclease family protein [Paracoccaceae bacterium]
MEPASVALLLVALLVGAMALGARRTGRPARKPGFPDAAPRPAQRAPHPAGHLCPGSLIQGPFRVIDGDTIVIGEVNIRLAGIDAPELDHPWGRKAKHALIAMCRGQTDKVRVTGELSHGRVVGVCFLPDGRDLAAKPVKQGLAVDWPKYSGGRCRHLEVPGVRSRLWRCDARQRGRFPPPAGGT